MKRRDFLKKAGITTLTAPIALNNMKVQAIQNSLLLNAADPNNDKIMVVIFLNGGNDGLNTLIPLDQYDNLANARGNVLIPEDQILAATSTNGWHPSALGLKSLFDDGLLGVVQSVGYPDQNRSHFRSTDIWNSASSAEEYIDTGWLGRWMDLTYPGYPTGYPNTNTPDPIAMTMISQVAETCQGSNVNYSYPVNNPFNNATLPIGAQSPAPDSPYGDELLYLRETLNQSNEYSIVVKSIAGNGQNSLTYPDTYLGNQLKNVSLLISGGAQTKVYFATQGGYDTHSGQVESGNQTVGTHAELLTELSEAVQAFQTDLQNQGLGNKVMGMIYTEFGRQIKSNGSDGTDHGTATPVFLFGDCVKSGILGNNPTISNEVQNQEGVPMQYDFRSVYGTLLKEWFEVPEGTVTDLLFDDFQNLPIIDACDAVSSEEVFGTNIEAKVSPNPVIHTAEITFQNDLRNKVLIQLFDSKGGLIKKVKNDYFDAGHHTVNMTTNELSVGVYYVRIQIGSAQKTIRIAKL